MDKMLKRIGTFNKKYNSILSSQFPLAPIYKSEGLKSHIMKRHPNCVKYETKIKEILEHPDFVGSKDNGSIEFIKIYNDNILLALQLDSKKGYFYVASLYDISTSKLNNRLHSGRIKPTK